MTPDLLLAIIAIVGQCAWWFLEGFSLTAGVLFVLWAVGRVTE